jgi:translation elongation factor P/translation initiation factor 5A
MPHAIVYATDLKPGMIIIQNGRKLRVLEISNISYGHVAIYTDNPTQVCFTAKVDDEFQLGE